MTPAAPTVALIHATPAAMAPARVAFAERFPDARLWNLLDDLLMTRADEAGTITPPLQQRMERLIEHALDGGADGVLLTCSMYGQVVHGLSLHDSPVLASDDALFARVAELRPRTVTVLGSLASAVEDTVRRLRAHPAATADVVVTGTVVEGAAEAAAAGDSALLERRVVRAACAAEEDADLLVLGQFSITPAAAAAARAVAVPVLSPPHLAADVLHQRLSGAGVG